MIKYTPPILLTLIMLIHSQTTSALELETAQLTETDFFGDIPVVLTATRLKQSKKNSPTATTIIDRKMIEASGFTEIADLLRLAPGMLVNYESGHIAAAGYQFLFDRYRVRLQILVDGMSVYTPSFGDMPWTQLGITMDDIERIEVIRGPSAASYGPNAMTGVISIITRHAALDKGLRVKLNQGVNGLSEQYFTIGNSKGNLDYKLSLGRRKDNGFKDRYDSKELSIVNFRGDYQATNNDVLTFSISNNSGRYQEDNPLDTEMPQHYKYDKQSTQQTKWVHSYADGDNLTLNYYQQAYDDNNNYVRKSDSIYIDEGAKTSRKNLELTYSTFSDFSRLTLGALYRKDNTLSSQYLFNINKDIITRQLFANAEFQLSEANVLNLDLLHDDNDTGDKTLSPRIALNHHINKNHTVRMSYAESTRSPFSLEEYLDRRIYVAGLGDVPFWKTLSDLKPEKIKSLDIGYLALLNNNATEIDVRVFKNQLSDIITLDYTPYTGGFVQGSAFNQTGYEATVSHKFNKSKIILNYARSQIKVDKLVFNDAIDFETGTPQDSASLLLMHPFTGSINGSLGYYYTGRYQQLCCESQQQEPRRRVDVKLSKSFKLDGHNARLNFVLQNITNEQVSTILLNNYDRQGYIGFSVEL